MWSCIRPFFVHRSTTLHFIFHPAGHLLFTCNTRDLISVLHWPYGQPNVITRFRSACVACTRCKHLDIQVTGIASGTYYLREIYPRHYHFLLTRLPRSNSMPNGLCFCLTENRRLNRERAHRREPPNTQAASAANEKLGLNRSNGSCFGRSALNARAIGDGRKDEITNIKRK